MYLVKSENDSGLGSTVGFNVSNLVIRKWILQVYWHGLKCKVSAHQKLERGYGVAAAGLAGYFVVKTAKERDSKAQ